MLRAHACLSSLGFVTNSGFVNLPLPVPLNMRSDQEFLNFNPDPDFLVLDPDPDFLVLDPDPDFLVLNPSKSPDVRSATSGWLNL